MNPNRLKRPCGVWTSTSNRVSPSTGVSQYPDVSQYPGVSQYRRLPVTGRLQTHQVPRRAQAGSRLAVTVGSVGADADVPAAVAMVTGRTGLVAEEAGPAVRARALPRQRVAAEVGGDRREEGAWPPRGRGRAPT